METFEQWKANRQKAVTGPQGDVSLVTMHELYETKRFPNIPGLWAPTTVHEPGLTFIVDGKEKVTINGELINGTVKVIADETVIDFGDGRTAMATSQPGSMHLLAIWDERCDALAKFKEIETYPYNPNWLIKGKFLQNTTERTFHFSHTGDHHLISREHESPGEIVFTYNDMEIHARPFVSGDHLIIVFRDGTSGKETYGMGRMLLVHPNSEEVELDFNKAFLPPCAFSPYFNCPMPPKENHFIFKVTAGEKHIQLNM